MVLFRSYGLATAFPRLDRAAPPGNSMLVFPDLTLDPQKYPGQYPRYPRFQRACEICGLIGGKAWARKLADIAAWLAAVEFPFGTVFAVWWWKRGRLG